LNNYFRIGSFLYNYIRSHNFLFLLSSLQVLSRVVQDDPPSLPADALFSKEFRSFVSCCLTKNYKHRPKYHKLMEHAFIRKYDVLQDGEINSALTNSGYQWFGKVMRQLEPRWESRFANCCSLYAFLRLDIIFRMFNIMIGKTRW